MRLEKHAAYAQMMPTVTETPTEYHKALANAECVLLESGIHTHHVTNPRQDGSQMK